MIKSVKIAQNLVNGRSGSGGQAIKKVDACAGNHCDACPFRRDSVMYHGVQVIGDDIHVPALSENEISVNLENLKVALLGPERPKTPFTCVNESNRQCVGAAEIQGFWHGPEIESVPNKRRTIFERL